MPATNPSLAKAMQYAIAAHDQDVLWDLEELIDAGVEVVKSWEHGDLAAAVSRLAEALGIR